MSEIIIIAGANGVGKTTFSKWLITETDYPFLNADEIEKELGLPNTSASKIKAGRVFFERLSEYTEDEISFIIESTLAGGYLVKAIETLKSKSYSVQIIYVFVEDVDICIQRIDNRVKLGGHFVPDEDVKRRFYRSRDNFWNVYKNLADEWAMYLNSMEGAERIVVGSGENYDVENEESFNLFIESLSK